MKELDLLGSIVDVARATGWAVVHFPQVPVKYPNQPLRWITPVRYDSKGFLDLLLVRERVLAAEVKATETGGVTLTREQEAWLTRWHVAGVRAFVWTVREWKDGTIENELKQRIRRDPVVYGDA